MRLRPPRGRRLTNFVVSGLAAASALLGLMALAWILSGVLVRGVGALNWSFSPSHLRLRAWQGEDWLMPWQAP
jgi:hypothetical protein